MPPAARSALARADGSDWSTLWFLVPCRWCQILRGVRRRVLLLPRCYHLLPSERVSAGLILGLGVVLRPAWSPTAGACSGGASARFAQEVAGVPLQRRRWVDHRWWKSPGVTWTRSPCRWPLCGPSKKLRPQEGVWDAPQRPCLRRVAGVGPSGGSERRAELDRPARPKRPLPLFACSSVKPVGFDPRVGQDFHLHVHRASMPFQLHAPETVGTKPGPGVSGSAAE